MALGKLQSVAKNMCWFFHGIRRLTLWPFASPPNPNKPLCPTYLPGYCPFGCQEIKYGSVFIMDFWLPDFHFPSTNNIFPPHPKPWDSFDETRGGEIFEGLGPSRRDW
jgi:hypothetical protein